MGTALDFSTKPGNGAYLKAHGIDGVILYVGPESWSKTTNKLAVIDFLMHGLGVAFNFERQADDHRGGSQRGAEHGLIAQQALTAYGQGPTTPIYISCDTEVPLNEFGLAESYVAGFRSSVGMGRPIGLYGESALIAYLQARGAITYGWRSESTAFPSDARAHLHLVQHYGETVPGLAGSYDVNSILAADWGQVPRPAPPVPPKPKVAPMYNPPFDINDCVASIDCPTGGAWLATLSGSFYGLGSAPYPGTLHGKPFFAGQTVSRLELPTASEAKDGYKVIAIAGSGNRYGVK